MGQPAVAVRRAFVRVRRRVRARSADGGQPARANGPPLASTRAHPRFPVVLPVILLQVKIAFSALVQFIIPPSECPLQLVSTESKMISMETVLHRGGDKNDRCGNRPAESRGVAMSEQHGAASELAALEDHLGYWLR